MRYKKGVGLIEIILVIFILTSVNLFSLKFIKGGKILANDINVDYYNNEILMFINNCKQFCRNNEEAGSIYFDFNNSAIKFYCKGKELKYMQIPREFKFFHFNISNNSFKHEKNTILINKKGFTSNACTIMYKDKLNNLHEITISVGNAYVDIKE